MDADAEADAAAAADCGRRRGLARHPLFRPFLDRAGVFLTIPLASMVQIRILPPEIVNRIAAGEVIERPASVVKELVENAIDAGATQIAIDVEDGGRKRILVRDNGSGMGADDLPLAFRSHATSKLPLLDRTESDEDPAGDGDFLSRQLFRIGTLGFRGEALATIASVAEVEAVSRTPEADCAVRYRIRGSEETGRGPEPVAGPQGTCFDVRNLFFNTPARRKFLRAGSTELSHVVEQTIRIALGFPGIEITLSSGGKRFLDCPATSSLRERLAAILGKARANELIELEDAAEGSDGGGKVRVHGFIGPPSLHRPDARGQHFFVDGRWVRDRVLGHALQEAFKGYQIPGQRPVAYIFVEIPPGEVDVNVHPTKCEVRFFDSGSVHRAVFSAVRSALERLKDEVEREGEPRGAPGTAKGDPSGHAERVRAAARDFYATGRPPSSSPRQLQRSGWAAGSPPHPRRSDPGGSEGSFAPPRQAELPLSAAAALQKGRGAGLQLLDCFILIERPDGLLLYDQHALHEKILFEKVLDGLREGEIARQRLLVPEVVEIPPDLLPLLGEVAARLGRLGFEIEPFGTREAAVHAVPALFDHIAAGPIVLETARWLREGAVAAADDGATEVADSSAAADPLGAEVLRLAQMVSCKKAVKAGMRLDPEEIRALLASAERAREPRFCPHGRPTSIFIPRGEIERRFQRR